MSTNLEGVLFVVRRIIPSGQGEVRHVLKNTDPEFSTEVLPFGEAYVSILFPDQKKDWKLHTQSTSRLAVLSGMIEFAMYDMRESSLTYKQFQRITIGDDNYGLLVIPSGVAATWRNISSGKTMILNIATKPHDPNESKIIPFEDIEFTW